MSNDTQPGFGVYVHWPYCARICPYCDFNVYKNREVDSDRWLAALSQDLSHWAAMTAGRKLTSIYFGGGTPSLAPGKVIEGVIEACERLWGFADAPEITIEANPTDTELSIMEDLRLAGVNRLSLGVQSLDDAALKFLGRNHDAQTAIKGVSHALELFDHVNIDLIYARPGQSMEMWRQELSTAISLGARHLSLYQLTIEPNTAFDRAVARNRWAPLDEDICADLFDATQRLTAAAGMPAYEVSNHAAPGEQSRHNLTYWRQGDYVGVGPGAHARLTIGDQRRAIETEKNPQHYLDRVEATGNGAVVDDRLTEEDILVEQLAMGLRTDEGVTLSSIAAKRLGGKISALAADGLVELDGDRLATTPNGRRLLNAVLQALLV